MRKKSNKKETSFIDKITLQNLKWIIVICMILSMLCEFVPSLFDICRLFNYHPLILFLQPHKDFFTNIMLGCLGSAVISYIMLLIPHKIKEQEQIEETSLHIKRVISDFLSLYNVLELAKSQTSIENLNTFEEKIKLERDDLYKSLKDLFSYDKSNNINKKKIDEMINKLLLIIKEIDVFINIYEINKRENSKYPIDLYNDIYEILFEELNKNYGLECLKQEFEKIVPYSAALMKDIEEMPHVIVEYNLKMKAIHTHLFYAKEISDIYQKYGDKNIKKKLDNIKKGIIENVSNNIDSMNYGEKIVEGDDIVYVVNDKRMTIDEYKDYCINEEFKRRGLIQ